MEFFRIKYVILISAIVLFTFELSAQIPAQSNSDTLENIRQRLKMFNSEGTEFWLCFQRNFKDSKTKTPQTQLHLEFFLTSEKDALVKIEIAGIGYRETVKIKAGTIQNVKIPETAQVRSDEVIEQLGIYISSNNPISVYGLNRRFQTTDTYLGLPLHVLGTEYRAIGYDVSDGLMSHFAVVATENGTQVTITPSTNTNTKPAGIPFTISLKRGEVFQVSARNERTGPSDITGTLITSNKKIAVFSGHQCAYVPSNILACNHLVEQIPPLPSWGKHYYLGMLKPRSNYTFRVLAHEPDTRVFLDAKLIRILGPGQYWDSTLSKNVQITTNKPILVAQYSQGFKNGDSIGDPMMLLVSPTQQFMNEYRFATPINGQWEHYINIVVPNTGIPSMKLNNMPIDKKLFTQLGISRYSIATVNVPFGSHFISGNLPFGMYSYGFGFGNDAYDAYGTMAGQSFISYEPLEDVLPPLADERYIDKELHIIFRDDREDDSGLASVRVSDVLGIIAQIPKIEPGAPQVSVKIIPEQVNSPGRIVFNASDLSGNKSDYTLCYYFDEQTGFFRYSLRPGIIDDCMPDPGFQIGVFASLMLNTHSVDFSSSGNVLSKGNFAGSIGFGGYGGLSVSRRVAPNLSLSGRISFENYPGTMESPDSIVSKIRRDDGALIDFQESRILRLNGISSTISVLAEYYLQGNFYLLGGLNFSIPLSKSIDYTSKILIPENYVYSNGRREYDVLGSSAEMSSLSSLRFGMALGAGINIPLTSKYTIFSEFIYNLPFSSMIDDGSWYIHRLGLQIGGKIRI